MIYIRWISFVILNVITNYLINYPLAPIIVLFARKDGQLPNWLYWFCTPDNTLDGDVGWQTKYRPYLNEKNKYQRWVNRFSWLHRNKMYGFSEQILGIKYKGGERLEVVGDTAVSNDPVGHSGTVVRYLYRSNKKIAFHYYYIRQYKSHPNKCIRISFGWKLWNFGIKPEPAATFGFSLSPWMHYIVA